MTSLHVIDEEFDSRFPLSFFAGENYPGKPEDGELAFSMWQERATQRAMFQRELFRAFLHQKLAERNEEILCEIEAKKIVMVQHENDSTREGLRIGGEKVNEILDGLSRFIRKENTN